MKQEHDKAKVTEITKEENVKSKKDEVGEDILASLDLDLTENPDSLQGGHVPLKVDTNDLTEDEIEEEVEEEEPEPEEEVEEEVDEDVVAKSKYDKLQAKMEKRIKKLTAEKSELEAAKPKDTTRLKLEKKSDAELEQLDEEIDDAIFEARNEGDSAKLRELRELRKEVREVVKAAPQRFAKSQLNAYNAKIEDISDMADDDGIDLNKEAAAIKSLAMKIYQNYPSMQKLKEGQAMALEMGYEYYKSQRQLGQEKSKEGNLKRTVTKLKKKTSLDSSKASSTKRGSSLRSKFKKAKVGSYDTKADFLGDIVNIDSYLK